MGSTWPNSVVSGYADQSYSLIVQQGLDRRQVDLDSGSSSALRNFQREKIPDLGRKRSGPRLGRRYCRFFLPASFLAATNGLDVRLRAAGGDVSSGIRAAQHLAQHLHHALFQFGHTRNKPGSPRLVLQKHVVGLTAMG